MARLLIVDDEPDILLMLRVNLEADGFETALAADGETALRRMSGEHFDLVVLDVMMPLLDGWGVLERLNRVKDAPRIIVLSARTAPQDRRRALEAGATAYMPKPFSPAHLSSEVKRLLAMTADEANAERLSALESDDGHTRPWPM